MYRAIHDSKFSCDLVRADNYDPRIVFSISFPLDQASPLHYLGSTSWGLFKYFLFWLMRILAHSLVASAPKITNFYSAFRLSKADDAIGANAKNA